MDAYSPNQIADRVQSLGVTKARMSLRQTMVLSVLAGAFIALGAIFYTVVSTDSLLGWGPSRLLGGVAFSLGLVLVLIAGAELFTGNNLLTMAWASRRISTRDIVRNWLIVYVGNFLGASILVVLAQLANLQGLHEGAVGSSAADIAQAKLELSWSQAFFRGVLCNVLVCLAVWLCMAAHTVTGKIAGIVLPITAFVAIGLEHSVANMYLLPTGLLNATPPAPPLAIVQALVSNLIPVTLGNIAGGAGAVALIYWLVFIKR
ncbi:MAG: formate/nitrite transporter family protein [Gammaproteobacteria bacterium]|nr:formate/nitrite transporter family protein [Gammaproteobacteria bacterium]